jgi:hypothetical protein
MSNKTKPPHKSIRLVEPKLKLKRPPSVGSGLKIAGAIVTAIVTLLWIVRGDDSPKSRDLQLTPAEAAASAADRVEQLTKELDGTTQNAQPSSLFEMTNEGATELSLNGVKFKIAVPQGWKPSNNATQIFLRKQGDPRICQLTTATKYDTAGLINDVKGKEVNFEAEYMRAALGATLSDDAQVIVGGKLLISKYGKNKLHYAVRTFTFMKLFADSQLIEQRGINAVFAFRSSMVRLQCMNMSGKSDDGEDMENMGKSLNIAS